MSLSRYKADAYAAMEYRWLEFWRQDKTFIRSVDERPSEKPFVFYDGPPFITGLPHHGTLLSSIAKDVIPRFKTMNGYRVERRWGWDCHGLPAENFVEKKLNLKDKKAVLEYGIDRYIDVCRQSMIQTGSEWEATIERVGRWVEFQGAYKTMDPDYMESVWWAFKKLYDGGHIYEADKVLLYCSRCATPVSKAEVAMDDSYVTVTDPSLFVRFRLQDQAPRPTYMVAWTTTPWTLPANSGLAVNPDLKYKRLSRDDGDYIIGAAATVFGDDPAAEVVDPADLINQRYEPLFVDHGSRAHRILAADYIKADEGSGIVHLAPAYGEEDHQLALDNDLEIVQMIDDDGCYDRGDWAGESVWAANQSIIDHLEENGALVSQEPWCHSYPHCHRCRTRLIYKAHPSWFLAIEPQRDRILELAETINWFPGHIKTGRFPNTVAVAPDWNISRDRFWATPLPVWRGQTDSGQTKTIVVGSYDELADLSGQRLDDYHRPFVDAIKFEKDGVLYERVDKVVDCWFESGAMPFAQFSYPFAGKSEFEANFPADYIVEYVGQVRAWFYYLHVLAVALFDQPAFRNVIVTGTITGSDGQKISKLLGNYTEPLDLIDSYSADAYRLILMRSVVMAGEDFALDDKDVADGQRQLDRLRNVLSFFLLYASADGWRPPKTLEVPAVDSCLDRWILSRLGELESALTTGLGTYNLVAATRPLAGFIDDLANWYVRRSRKRFWKTEDDADKAAAYQSLHFVLRRLALVIAPVCPFLAEEIKRSLTPASTDYRSIHLDAWPQPLAVDEPLLTTMATVRSYVNEGLAQRAAAGIKVRQPLARATLAGPDDSFSKELREIVMTELNVRNLDFRTKQKDLIVLDMDLDDSLKREGAIRDLVRIVQNLRKKADLDVSDRIDLCLSLEPSTLAADLEDQSDYVANETLALSLKFVSEADLYDDRLGPIQIGVDPSWRATVSLRRRQRP